MNEFALKYGCNPNQKPSRIYMADGSDLPLTILNGRPGYINFLDALNSWQLVKELKEAGEAAGRAGTEAAAGGELKSEDRPLTDRSMSIAQRANLTQRLADEESEPVADKEKTE